MSTKIDGGPAFPSGKSETAGYENSHPYYEGMTLRDYFAAKAPREEIDGLTGTTMADAAQFLGIEVKDYQSDVGGCFLKLTSKARYMWADAMLAERSKD